MKVKVSTHPSVKDEGLSQIYQTMACKQAILVPDGAGFMRITPLVLCRDFLVDVYTFDEVGREFDVYGMHGPKVKPSRDGVYLMLALPKAEDAERFRNNIGLVHNIEVINGYEQTQVFGIENGADSALVVVGDKQWLNSCLSLSLYSSLLRIACQDVGENWIESMRALYKEKKEKETDALLVDSVKDETWDRVLSDLSVLKLPTFCGFDPKKEDEYVIHHNSGFYSIFGRHRELDQAAVRKNTHWQHFTKEGYELHTKAA